MLAVLYERSGEPASVLKVVEVQRPTPKRNEVLVKMQSCPVVPADLATIRGVYRTPQKTPTVPGYSGCGEVVEIGPNVRSFKPGAQVLILAFKKQGWSNGCWQEFLCIEETELLPIPAEINPLHVFDFFNTPLTAYVMTVKILNLGKGQTLLLTAAGSTVGRMILELAKIRGFNVIAVVRRQEQVASIKALGAMEVICSATEDITKRTLALTKLQGVDAAIDAVGGDISSHCFRSLAENGKMIVFGLLDLQRESQFDVRKMLFYNLSVQGFWIPGWWFSTDLTTRTDAVNKTFDLIKGGHLITPVEKEYSLSEINQAVAHAEKPGNKGRVTLNC